MIAQFLTEQAGWAWLTLGLALLALELVLPGVFLMWIGFAAAAVGAVTVFGLSELWWDWKAQLLTFGALAVLFAVMGSRMTRGAGEDDDAADGLNQPARRLVGRSGPLVDAIEGGVGRMRVGDTVWRVEGPDAPAGTRVRVIGSDDGTLRVEPEAASASV